MGRLLSLDNFPYHLHFSTMCMHIFESRCHIATLTFFSISGLIPRAAASTLREVPSLYAGHGASLVIPLLVALAAGAQM